MPVSTEWKIYFYRYVALITFPNPYVIVSFKPWWDFHVTKIVDSFGLIISHFKNCTLLGQIGKSYLAPWKGQT